MNEVIECLLTRRSVRSYLPKQVEEEKLQEILLAGTYAASGMGRQPVRIVVLQDPAEIAQLEPHIIRAWFRYFDSRKNHKE